MKYAKEHGFPNPKFYVDDGYTGTNFDRPNFNEMSADIEKGLAGEHLGAPPYGYLRNPDDKTRWLVDEEAAVTVRRIFSLCM